MDGKDDETAPTWIGTTNRGQVQLRRPRWNAWTTARRRRFLEALAASANVAMAAAAVGTTPGNVRSLRYRDAGFAALWDKAIQVARDRLEEELLSRALGQTVDGVNPVDMDLDAPPPGPFDMDLALKMLALNRKQVRVAPEARTKPVTHGDMEAALMRRLVALGERLAREPDAAERAAADRKLLADADAAMRAGRSIPLPAPRSAGCRP